MEASSDGTRLVCQFTLSDSQSTHETLEFTDDEIDNEIPLTVVLNLYRMQVETRQCRGRRTMSEAGPSLNEKSMKGKAGYVRAT